MTTEAVAKGADHLSKAEDRIKLAQVHLNRMTKVFDDLYASGTLGYLESSQYGAYSKALAGKLAAVEADVFSFHQMLTNRAQELGVDLPQPKSGGKR